MALLTNSKGGTVQATGAALAALKKSGWVEAETKVSASPVPATAPKTTPRKTRNVKPKTT